MADYLNPLNKKVDANQVLIRAYDEEKNMLRVDAEVTATIGSVDVIIDAASGDNIKISDGVDTLSVNPDGSINVNVQDITLDKNNDSVEVFQTNHDNLNVNSNLQVGNTDVSSSNPVPMSAQDLDIRDLQFATDKIDASGSSVSVSNFPSVQDVNIVSSIELEVTNSINSPIPSLVKNAAIDVDYDDIEVTAKNDDGSPTTILIRKSLSVVRTLTLLYDSDGDFQRLVKS